MDVLGINMTITHRFPIILELYNLTIGQSATGKRKSVSKDKDT